MGKERSIDRSMVLSQPNDYIIFSQSLSIWDLESALEKAIAKMTPCLSDEESVDSVLQRFSFLTLPEKSSMCEDYQVICKRGESLRDSGMNTLVMHAHLIRERCQKGIFLKEDALFLLAIARESIRKYFGIYPYNTQMLTLLGLLSHPGSIKGRIAQVKTGEGKSTIIAMLALFFGCQGKCIDIISSSRYLAQRDFEKYESFFERFGITTSHLCSDSPSKSNFSGQIIFSTNFDAEFSIMRDYFHEIKMRTVTTGSQVNPRPFDVVIVDEVDNLFIDSALNSARIAYEGTLSMRDVYSPLFEFVKRKEEALRASFAREKFSRTKVFVQAKKIVKDSLKGPREVVELFLDERVEMLLCSAMRALELSEGKDYIVRQDGDTKEIVIVDQINTGRLAEKSKWSHGLHQFLEVKHELPIEEEYIMPASLCHPVYFGSYQSIYGLTGTIGSEIERREIQETYGVSTFEVPSYRPCLRKDLEPIVCLSKEDHYKAIAGDILEMVSCKRPSLVLCESIQDAQDFFRYCASRGISTLILTACQAEDEDYIITQAGFPGKVTIATNTAGRGTDIILQKEACSSGGLHVIFTYLPVNERVEQQGIGRAGRQGQSGSSRVIALVLIPESSYHSRCVKSPGFDDRKLAHISNIGPICDRSNRGDFTQRE